ncbi:hypothetical protein Trydic_g13088 [Trypoxylus dichotomus]
MNFPTILNNTIVRRPHSSKTQDNENNEHNTKEFEEDIEDVRDNQKVVVRQNWDKFLLLTWKNWLLQWRHPVQTILEILAPVLFAALLILVRGLISPEERPKKIFSPFELHTFTPASIFIRIAWSPCDNKAINKIMNNVAAAYNFTPNACYVSSKVLENALWDKMKSVTLAGVQFSDDLSGKDNIEENLEVVIR